MDDDKEEIDKLMTIGAFLGLASNYHDEAAKALVRAAAAERAAGATGAGQWDRAVAEALERAAAAERAAAHEWKVGEVAESLVLSTRKYAWKIANGKRGVEQLSIADMDDIDRQGWMNDGGVADEKAEESLKRAAADDRGIWEGAPSILAEKALKRAAADEQDAAAKRAAADEQDAAAKRAAGGD